MSEPIDMPEQFLREQQPRYDNFLSELSSGQIPKRTDGIQEFMAKMSSPEVAAEQQALNPRDFALGELAGQAAQEAGIDIPAFMAKVSQPEESAKLQQQDPEGFAMGQQLMQKDRPKAIDRNIFERLFYNRESMRANDATVARRQDTWDKEQKIATERQAISNWADRYVQDPAQRAAFTTPGLRDMAIKQYGQAAPLGTTAMRNYQAGLADPAFAAQQLALKKAGRSNVNVNMPGERLKTTDALRYSDESGNHPSTYAELDSGKYRLRTGAQQTAQTSQNISNATVDEYKKMLFSGPDALYKGVGKGWQDRMKFIAKSNWENVAQSDPRYAAATAYTDGTLSPMVRALGTVGSLSDGDIERARGLIPTIGGLNPDSPAVAMSKINKLERLIDAGNVSKKGGKQLDTKLFNEIMGDTKSPASAPAGKVGDTWTDPATGKRYKYEAD